MLLSLKSNPQIQKYIYKMLMIYMQAVSIIYLKLIPNVLSFTILDIRIILKNN